MKYALIHCNILDGTKDMHLLEDQTIVIEDDTIISIQKEIPDHLEIIDLKGAYVTPGLINLHTHLPASGKPSQTSGNLPRLVGFLKRFYLGKQVMYRLTQKNVKTALYSGVTTLRAVGGLIDADSKIRQKIKEGKIEGPRILASNMAISVEGGHMAGSLATIAHSEEEAKKQVQMIASQGVDLIKLMITGGVLDADESGTPGALKMPASIVQACCKEANYYGLEVAAHVESTQGMKVALKNGVHTIEHGSYMDEELIQLFKEKKAALVTTLSPVVPMLFDRNITKMDDLYIENGLYVMKGMVDGAKKAIEHGIPLGCGTDTGCPYVTHYDGWREMAHLVKFLGVTPSFALYTMTLGNASIIHLEDEIGSVEVGKKADLVILPKNPITEGFDVYKEIQMVIYNGKKIKQPKVKRNQQFETLFEGVK